MKTRKLIELLRHADPEGEAECCVGNADIVHVFAAPAYYDGKPQILKYDDKNKIVGATITAEGLKVVIQPYSIEEIILNNEERIPVEYVGLTDEYIKSCEDHFDKTYQEAIDIRNQVEREHFVKYIDKRFGLPTSDSVLFYNTFMSYDDPMPPDIEKLWRASWHDRRELQWDKEIHLNHGVLERRS